MNISDLLQKIKPYKTGTTSRSWIKTKNSIYFSNEYIEVKRLDSSNKWLGTPHASEMGKCGVLLLTLKKIFVRFLIIANYQKYWI